MWGSGGGLTHTGLNPRQLGQLLSSPPGRPEQAGGRGLSHLWVLTQRVPLSPTAARLPKAPPCRDQRQQATWCLQGNLEPKGSPGPSPCGHWQGHQGPPSLLTPVKGIMKGTEAFCVSESRQCMLTTNREQPAQPKPLSTSQLQPPGRPNDRITVPCLGTPLTGAKENRP